jgi:RimJ/RimL family protein N-acetyltransferase
MALLRVEPVVLEGRLVRLEPATLEHAAAMAEVAEEETFQYFVTGAPKSVDEAGMREYIRSKIENPSVLLFAVYSKDQGRYVGMTSYMDIRPEHRNLEIGMTWYAREARGTKVNPECKLLLIGHAFEVLGCVRVQLKTDGRNKQSQAAIAKLGATYEGTLRRHMIFERDGFVRDTVMFSILPEEWPGVKARLQSRLRASG